MMKHKIFSGALALAYAASMLGCSNDERRYAASSNPAGQKNAPAARASASPQADTHDGHAHGPIDANRVPAFETNPKNLAATLPPEMFTGMTRAAYQSVKEIPQTIAQLPCYCHCDKGFGHKSLHSCFVDKHASQCAVCIDEALAAYKMHKELGLSPEQIRERIVAEYSARQ